MVVEVVVNRGIINIAGYNDSSTINLVADIDYTFANPYTLPIIPRAVTLLKSTGEIIETKYAIINQTTGIITINVGTSYTGAIINTTGA